MAFRCINCRSGSRWIKLTILTRCDSYKKFEEDDCYGDTLQMGEALDVENAVEGRYYLDTKSYQDDDSGTLYSYSKT